jgi:DNA-binding response OmpR family regulator
VTQVTDTDRDGSVLVVERDPGVAELARLYLSREGYDVHLVTEPERAVSAVRRLRPDVVVLDLASGVHQDVAAAAGAAPVVCVVPGGDAGPGPYAVPRPFSPRVLVAMVARALRGHAPEPAAEGAAGLLRVGEVVLDAGARTVAAAGAPKSLTATEFDLLAFLMGRPGRVFTREQLLAAVWGSAESAGTRTVDVHIAQLRAKLGARSPLRTVRGIGYAADP